MSVKPHVVLVPGAWHKPDAYTSLTNGLQMAGYKITGVELPSVFDEPAKGTETFDEDVAAIKAAIQAAADGGSKVAVIGHSYGGIIASEAIKGSERDIDRMIYLCAFANPAGVSLLDAIGGETADWFSVEGNTLTVNEYKDPFYNDVSQEVADEFAKKTLHKHSWGTFKSKATYSAFTEVPSVYIICNLDHAIPAAAQEHMSGQRGKWDPVSPIKLDAGHFPHVAKPEETVQAVRRALGESV